MNPRMALLFLVIMSAFSFSQELPEPRLRVSGEITFLSKYVWRGFADYNGPSLQTTARVGWRNIEGFWWTDTAITPGSSTALREHDFDIHYSQSLHKTAITAGYAAYCVRVTPQTSHEIYLSASRGERLTTTVGIYQNVGNYSGTYISAGIAREFLVGHKLPLQLATTVGFNRKMYIPEATFSDATLSVSYPRKLNRNWLLAPMLGLSKSLNAKYFANQAYVGITVRGSN